MRSRSGFAMDGGRVERLGEVEIAVYRLSVAHPDWSVTWMVDTLGLDENTVQTAIERLIEMRLLQVDATEHRELNAVSPETAIAELLYEDEVDLLHRQRRIATQRSELTSLLPIYFAGRRARRSQEAIEVITDVAQVRARLGDYARRAQSSVLVVHPGGGLDESALDSSLELDRPVLERGVQLRILLQHVTRHHQGTMTYAQEVVRRGAEIKTVPVLPSRMLIFDQEVAFIPADHDVEAGAVVVKEPGMVIALTSVFEMMWAAGRPYPTQTAQRPKEVTEDIVRSVAEQLAAGAKDEVIARRLGVSVRTCRRYIAVVMERLGADSRFQAGYLAASSDLID